ncbi:methyltransferase domain-containing protein [Halopseudomonas oceani]|uniref:class I SAM-dependent methyltransferase n=1 Tax=Halopseudomonas oceani TaxID=1708783 RepID=UPI002AA894BF|nr:methyltransferase domain-containing protein [Halopseudomonas oceani]
MSRDLQQYQQDYHALPFEATQLSFRRRVVLEQIAACEPRRLVEVGCGLRPLFCDWTGSEVITVVEPAAEFASNARVLSADDPRVRVLEGRLEDVADQLDGEPDMVIVSSLLHEVEHPEALLAAVRRICGTDTLVHFNVPNAYSIHRLLAVEMGLIEDPFTLSGTQTRMQQHSTFSQESLQSLLEANGFAVQDSGSFFIKPFTHAQMQQLVDQGMLTADHLEGLFKLCRRLPAFGSEIYANAKLC